MPIVPVLAEEAISGAAAVEHSQVVTIRVLGTFAYPFGDTVGW